MALEFTRNPASEVTEVKVSGGRVRNIRYTRRRCRKPNRRIKPRRLDKCEIKSAEGGMDLP